jgi:UDP-N-acetylmuramoyl-L-alanyl-D-glutamate--2,6-diaminopimelate ligase
MSDLEEVCLRHGWDVSALRACSRLAVHHEDVAPGSAYVAVRGARFDGHGFIREAVARGARVVFYEPARFRPESDAATWMAVQDARIVEPALAAPFYGHPSRELRLTGITGTNGKTTSSVLAAAVERALGHRVAVVNTLGVFDDAGTGPFPNALPSPATLQRFLRECRANGHDSAVLECSSWALLSGRTRDCHFDRACLTALTRDHLDVHPTMDAYARAKWTLVDQLAHSDKQDPSLGIAHDFPVPEPIPNRVRTLTFGLDGSAADLQARVLEMSLGGSVLQVLWRSRPVCRMRTSLPGTHNVLNILGVLGMYPDLVEAQARGVRTVLQAPLFEDIHVPGRLERIPHPGGVHVYVDYAHTPHALETVLQALTDLHRSPICVVFGCGGGRDRGKRPAMGEVAARYARDVFLTSDNPREEDPERIALDIAEGIGSRSPRVVAEPDRREAIRSALRTVRRGDVLVVAGKGHETEQIVGGRVIPFDDRTVLSEEITRTA